MIGENSGLLWSQDLLKQKGDKDQPQLGTP